MSDGEAFRQKVASLLRAAGMPVEIEIFVSGKHVDLIATTSVVGRPHRIAIECKSSGRKIGLDSISSECLQYSKIVQDQTSGIDEAWIVGSKSFTAQALTYAESCKGITLRTYDELLSRLFDIQPYLASLREAYEQTLKEDLYVPLRAEDGTPLAEKITRWIESSDRPGLAIIAGYGRGKTTFAERLAGELSKAALEDPEARMPILLRLGDIAHEVKLSGLILSTIAGQHIAQRLSFEFLTRLNGAGRFVIIADGFDEMKYGLSFEEFDRLFGQIRALVTGKAKVLLLGRPSAFLSDSEELAVLTSADAVPSVALAEPEAERFETLSIDLFTEAESRAFVSASVANMRRDRSAPLSRADLDRLVEPWFAAMVPDLLRRPVHAWMLAVVINNRGGSPSSLGLFALYEKFVEAITERELKKEGRDARINATRRRKFARELAWWSWTVFRRTGFPAHEIPDTLFVRALNTTSVPLETGKRELIVSAPVDRKESGETKLAFPHRSIQEFLVADYLLSRAFTPDLVRNRSASITAEVADFLVSSGRNADLQVILDRFLTGGFPRFHLNLVRMLAKAVAIQLIKLHPDEGFDNPYLALLSLFVPDPGAKFGDWPQATIDAALKYIGNGKGRQSAVALALLLAELVNASADKQGRLFSDILKRYAAILPGDSLLRFQRSALKYKGVLGAVRPEVFALLAALGRHSSLPGVVRVNGQTMLKEMIEGLEFALDGIPAGRRVYLTVPRDRLATAFHLPGDADQIITAIEYFQYNTVVRRQI